MKIENLEDIREKILEEVKAQMKVFLARDVLGRFRRYMEKAGE